ncbi:MAG: hypothetical protein CM15mP18_4120 [Methanobacteriota archaeon]|nr:MAG: hypothetical protein CM15mP18_4120 [Euryarchaeota archaeon]
MPRERGPRSGGPHQKRPGPTASTCCLIWGPAHRAGRSNEGVTVAGANGAIEHAWANAETIEHAIEVATEAVCGLLRIDQVISARGD